MNERRGSVAGGREAFDDPRHRRSEELSFLAEQAEDKGDLPAALAHYAEAAGLEEALALSIPCDVPKVREVFAISAVALWLRAERWSEAARAGCGFLAQAEGLTAAGARATRVLVDRAWRMAEVEHALGEGRAFAVVEVVMSGGLVRAGIAPIGVVGERREVLASLLMRSAEHVSGLACSPGGAPMVANRYEIFEGPAVSGGFGLHWVVAASAGDGREASAASPREVVDGFLALAEAAMAGREALRARVGDARAAEGFARGFYALSPDGSAVEEVVLATIVRGRFRVGARLTGETRGVLGEG